MPTVAILAGGKSRRMGQDKARLVVDGVPLLERAVGIAQAVVPKVLVVGRSKPDDWVLDGAEFFPDAWGEIGPLGGLLTALEHSHGPVLLLACDLPRLTTAAVRWLCDAWPQWGRTDGLAIRNGGQVEPLFSVYAPPCLPQARQRVAEARYSLRGLIDAGDFGRLDAPPEVARCLLNVNTPEELHKALTDAGDGAAL